MKKSILIFLFAIFCISKSYSQKYFGKSYTPTQVIGEFYDITDVTKGYTVMGKLNLVKGFVRWKRLSTKSSN